MIGFLLFNYFEYCYNVPRASWLSGNSDSNPRGKVPSSYVAKKTVGIPLEMTTVCYNFISTFYYWSLIP